VERLKGQIGGDIARLEGQSVAEALKELEAERVLLRHRQVLSQLLPQIETFWPRRAGSRRRQARREEASTRGTSRRKKLSFSGR
jgi:hypothetical protein